MYIHHKENGAGAAVRPMNCHCRQTSGTLSKQGLGMNKLTLLGIATQPKYDDNDQWTGAEICASIEAEEDDGLHRVEIKLEISPTIADSVKNFGYSDAIENYLMKRVEACLNVFPKKWPGTERDAGHIYEVILLKLPCFMAKSAAHIFYSQNFRTGVIDECTEDMLDRNV